MSGRAARKKKLVRTKRLSDSDSSDHTSSVDGGGAATPSATPSLATWGLGQPGMADGINPKWRRAAVRAVELQESRKAGQVLPHPSSVSQSYTGNGKIGDIVNANVVPDVIPPVLPEVVSKEGCEGEVQPPVFQCSLQQLVPPVAGLVVSPQLFPTFPSPLHSQPCLPGSQAAPPPPPAWSDPPDSHGCDTDTESMPSSTHSSVLVDMGKVVGVLRTYPHEEDGDDLGDENGTVEEEVSDYDFSDNNFVSESPTVCQTCVQEARGQESEIEDSLLGDPLVYATFVAPVQQYSTETEPSRQPSFNSRQPSFNSRHPSFKQNSSEAEAAAQPEAVNYPAPVLTVPGAPDQQTHSDLYKDEVKDIYAEVPMDGWPSGSQAGPDVSEVSTAELNHQVNQERLSFIHSQESSEEPDYDQVPLPAPPHQHKGGSSNRTCKTHYDPSTWHGHGDQTSNTRETTPLVQNSKGMVVSGMLSQQSSQGWEGGEESDTGANTIKRRSKRDRNRTGCADRGGTNNSSHSTYYRRSKSRSKSRSPGREVDRAIVIVHHTTCSHGQGRVSRDGSPDNLSESSISFHENEVNFDLSPGSVNRPLLGQDTEPPVPEPPLWYDGPMDPCVSVSRDPNMSKKCDGPSGPSARILQYSNWESCRESWFSSGSDPRPSSGSDCPPRPPSYSDNVNNSGSLNNILKGSEQCDKSNCKSSAPNTPHLNRTKEQDSSTPCRSPSCSTLPRSTALRGGSAQRQSSRESGSSSSRPSSRPGTRPPTRSHSPGVVGPLRFPGLGGSAGNVTGRSILSRPAPVSCVSRDSTPSESGCSSGPSAPSASDQEVGCSDLVFQEPVSEEALIENLYHRFKRDQIYTWVSTMLVSINSYKKLSLYTPEVIDKYRCHCLHQLPPHIYSLADRAWHNLRDRGEDQAVILTGESGAGKTEAGKLVMQYIAAVTGQANEFQDIKYQLLQSNPVLEGFGNAKTLHNDNSSRFGKYIEISFDFKGDPTGGNITNYWLEKSRVSSQNTQERNFHIFYQLLAGADVHLLKELKLQRNVDSYSLLQWSGGGGGGGHASQQALTDRRDFLITKKAMEDLCLRGEEICDILKVVSAVLKLGNLRFVPTTNMDGTEGCSIANEYELYDVAQLLRADVSSLRSGLLARSTELSDDTIISDLSTNEAEFARDALCRTMYSRLFTLLVSRINESIKVKTHRKHKVLGILDIYGFEAFQQNGFEQFIINFANEKLQQVFIDSLLKQEQEEYLAEGVEWTQVGFFSNAVICHLIEQGSHGIFTQLDEASARLPTRQTGANSSNSLLDQEFLDGLNSSLTSHPHYEQTSGQDVAKEANPVPAHSFRIKHYAGSVTYHVSGFVEKNTDLLDKDLSCVMFQSDHPLLRTLFPEGNSKRTIRRLPATVGTQFKISIGALINNLATKTPHFVRCVKPNENKLARVFDMTLVQHQIRYLGLVELARLRRNGFTYRDQYGTFLHRFKMLCPHTWPQWHGPAVEGVTYLLRELPISAKEYAFGKTKIFIRSLAVVDQLEDWRRDRLDELATLIQKIWRGWKARQNWNKLRDSQIVICTYWKRWKDKSHITELKQRRKQEWAVVIIQKHYRRWQISRWLQGLAHNLPSESPVCREWPRTPAILKETSFLLRKLYHKWRCERFRVRFDQTSRNRMREKVTASLIFKDRKSSYPRSISHPFLGDYVRLRQNPQWKKMCGNTNDQYVVFADIINKITRTSGKFVPILFVISTSSMLILDQRTMQIKYRVPASEIFKLSLSPYFDDIAVFHVRASSPTQEMRSQANIPGCLSSEAVKRKGDFVFQTGHVIEIVTKLFLVVQNATGKPPAVNINTQFDANFGTHTVTFQFKTGGQTEVAPGHVKLVKRGNKMEVLL